MAVHKKFNALGRGLDALISTEAVRTSGSSTINEIALDQIEPNPNQPRHDFDEESLQELANTRCARYQRTASRSSPVSAAGVPHSWPD